MSVDGGKVDAGLSKEGGETPPVRGRSYSQVADNAVVTVSLMNFTNSVAFHKNAFALGMAPLSDIGEQLGNARVASVVDPRTGLAMRSRIWYAPDASAVKVALDVLYAVKCLDGNLACRLRK